MPRIFSALLIRKLMIVLLFITSNICFAETPIFAIASNLTAPMTEISELFQAETGETVKLTFGSSGNLARQIIQGAPFDLFISAGKEYVDFLSKHGAAIKSSTDFIYGEIGFYVPNDSKFNSVNSLASIRNELVFNEYRRMSIANPEHAPYGVAAIQALQNTGVWAIDNSKLILAENVSQVIHYALSGNVDIAIIPRAFQIQNNLQNQGRYFAIPSNWHSRIIQLIVTFESTSQVSSKFKDFLYGADSQTIFKRYGYHYTGNE